MKIPIAYELNGRRRFLLVQDGETISVGRAGACSIQLAGEAVQEVELTAQFVNGCQFVVVHPANGGVTYAQPLPWKLTLGGNDLEMLRPAKAAPGMAGKVGRELILQGLTAGETRLVLPPEQPLLLGASQDCDVVIPDAGCPAVLLALWATAGGKVSVQVLDDSAVVGWVGRAGEAEAELELPLSLSIGGRVLLIRSGEAGAKPHPVAKATVPAAASVAAPKASSILAKNSEYAPKIVARQGSPSGSEEGGGHFVPKADQPGRPALQAPPALGSPIPLPRPAGRAAPEEMPLIPEPPLNVPKPYSPTVFLLFSWLLVILMFAVALVPGQGLLTPEQIKQLWYAAGGTLMLTLVLGLGVLLK